MTAEFSHSRIWDWTLPDRIGVLLCAGALLVLIPLVTAPALNDYRVSDSFRLVGQIDFPTALEYFHQTSGYGRNEYRPVVLLTYAWDNWLWGDRPLGYHLTNFLVHTVNGVLLLLVLHRLTGNLLLAFVAATLFSIHPTHHSRVAWIAARDSSVCLLFLLTAWWAYLSFRQWSMDAGGPSPPGSGGIRFKQAVSWIAFSLALLSYEGAVSFPFLLFGMEMLLRHREASWWERMQQALKATLPYFLLLMAYVAWWLILFEGKLGSYDLDLTWRGLGRDFYRLHYRLFHHIQHWLGLFYLLLAVLVWRQRRQHARLLGFSALVLWVGYLPFLPVQGYADRFGFLSCIGVSLFLCLPLQELGRPGTKKAALAALVPVLVLALLAGYYTRSTNRRLQEWMEAGEIANSILAQLKATRPSFPPNARLVFEQIPAMHRNAYVFPVSFRAALGLAYGGPPGEIFYYPTLIEAASREELLAKQPAFHFLYLPEKERLVEISARWEQSTPRR